MKDPEPQDWVKVKAYAARIRAIRLDPYSYPSYYAVLKLAGSMYLTLKRCLGAEPLLPNLRSFEWTQVQQNEPEDVASLLLMLNPKVSSMDVVLGKMGIESAIEIADALSSFGENPAQLRTIHIVSPPCPPIEAAVLALGFRQQHLREFRYTWENEMSLDTVTHLSSMNNLQEVSIRANRDTSRQLLEWAKDRSGHFFPSLQLFSLYTDTLSVCEAWLDTIRHPGLSSLAFTVNQAPTATALREFFLKLVAHPAHGNLSKLRFSSTTPCSRNDTHLHVLRSDMIASLLQLNLQVLKLEPGGPIEIDDDFVVRMARAWPRLRVLELNPEWRRYTVPTVTLAGLIPLAQHCPDVNAFAIPISTDVSAFEEEYEAGHRPTGGFSFRQCYMVGVGSSPVDQEADHLMIAGFLSDLCPDLMALQTSWARAGPPKEDERGLDVENQEMGDSWRQIEKYAREMARGRRQERMWMG